jgi:hypothetical protein
MSRELVHPGWCARNYRCTVSRSGGEHLSQPLAIRTAAGQVSTVVSLAQRPTDETPMVELRVRIRLSARDEHRQARQIHHLVARLAAAVGEVTR